MFALVFLNASLSAQENADSLVQVVAENGITYHTFAGRAKCNWQDDKIQMDFQASIRMIKDSLIWGSITGPLGIEFARFLVTRDSFRLISNLSKEYIVSDVSYVQRWLSLPLNFYQLQQLLSGQLVTVEQAVSGYAANDTSTMTIYQENQKLYFTHTLNPQSYTLHQAVLKDKLLDQSITATFDKTDSLAGKLFMVNRAVVIARGKDRMNLQMDFFKYSVNEALLFPFEISAGFKRIE